MSKLIITMVGISIISNEIYHEEFESDIACMVEGQRPNLYDLVVTKTTEKLLRNVKNGKTGKNISAEITSLKTFKNSKALGLANNDVIAIFSTDTEDGKFCAEVNKKVLETLAWCKVLEPIVITGLKTKKIREDEDISESFKKAGLQNLKAKVDNLLSQNYDDKYFNITGGFKATIPYITILAFEKGMSLFYLYEESDKLIIINKPERDQITFDNVVSLTQSGG